MRIPSSVYWKLCSIDLLLFLKNILSRSRIIYSKRLLYSLFRLLFVSRSLSLELLIKSNLSSLNHWYVIMDGQEQQIRERNSIWFSSYKSTTRILFKLYYAGEAHETFQRFRVFHAHPFSSLSRKSYRDLRWVRGSHSTEERPC